ncbi:TPA: DNA primase catalytic subunit PriS [Candidatus Micrarchaeota archaeon]|nr:DNA primase catalytic subunit PriS [Candidatus Micrarchaeota archaeon]
MDPNERQFVLKKFSAYYSNANIQIPSINQREFGFGNIKKIDARHLSFGSAEAFRTYLVTNTPLFVSHSAAYYERPDATPMERKGILGADLIFDLDLHAEGKYGVYAMLGKVKDDAIRLMEDFIVSDFGISKKEIILVFSGNRGYHIHVRDTDYLGLGSEERRELAEYANGIGLNYLNFFDVSGPKRALRIIGPKESDSGYRGRFAKAVIRAINEKTQTFSRKFSNIEERERFTNGIKEGNWSKSSVSDILERLKPIAEQLPIRSIGVDTSVTQDIARLIRVPNSIHGETGLVAKIVPLANIDSFNPLDDALAFGTGANSILAIEFNEDVPQLNFAKSSVGPFKKGEKKELPESISLFFVLKGSAKVIL